MLLMLTLSSATYAQVVKRKPPTQSDKFLRVALPNHDFTEMFVTHPGLKSFFMVFENNVPLFVICKYENKEKWYDRLEHYDLRYEGDLYLFNERFNFPPIKQPQISIQNFRGTVDTHHQFNLRNIYLKKDSVFFDYVEPLPGSEIEATNPDPFLGIVARYNGSLDSVAKKIEKQLLVTPKSPIKDSIIIFQVSVSVKGQMSDMKLISGKASTFTEIIRNVFEHAGHWYPNFTDAGPVASFSRIYAKLRPDGSIYLSTPPKMRTLRGE